MFRVPRSPIRVHEGGGGLWGGRGEVVSPCRRLEGAPRSRPAAPSHRRHVDGRGDRRRARGRVHLPGDRGHRAVAPKEGLRRPRRLVAREGGVRQEHLEARSPEAHDCAPRSRHALRRHADPPYGHGDGSRFGRVDAVRRPRAGGPAGRRVVGLLRAAAVLAAPGDRWARARRRWPAGGSAARCGAAHPGGSRGGGGGGSGLRRAAGGEKSPDPAARTGAWRGDPRHDGGADGARDRGLAERGAPPGDGTRGGGAGGDICRRARGEVSTSGIRCDQASLDGGPVLAREIMIPEPYVAAAGATSAEVALLMRAKDISVVPVVDNPKDRRYLGTISDRDIVTGCVAAGHDPMTCKVQTHARQDTEVVTLDTELEGYKIERLDDKDTHIRSTIVVVDGNKRVVGFIPHPEFIQGIIIVRE